jgi:hypothetical protein
VNGWDTQTLCPSRERGPGRAKPCLDSREGPEDSGSGRPGGREVGKLRNLRKLRRVGSSGGSGGPEGREVQRGGRSGRSGRSKDREAQEWREVGRSGGSGGRTIGEEFGARCRGAAVRKTEQEGPAFSVGPARVRCSSQRWLQHLGAGGFGGNPDGGEGDGADDVGGGLCCGVVDDPLVDDNLAEERLVRQERHVVMAATARLVSSPPGSRACAPIPPVRRTSVPWRRDRTVRRSLVRARPDKRARR